MPTEVASLDPRFTTRSLDIKVTRLIHAGLVGLDPETLSPTPLVAESWERLGPRSLRVTLRRGLRFHSGAALTARDVCATLSALADPTLGSPHRAVVAAIGGCVPLGSHQLEIRLSEDRATLLTDLEVPILRADQARSSLRADGILDGLGPYRVARMEPGVIHLAPVATGLLPKPRWGLVVRTIRDENARALRLLAKRADIAPNAISATLLPTLAKQPGLVVRARPGANVTYLLIHNERPPLDRVEVRRALARGIDRALLTRTLLASRARAASWIFPEGHWAHPGGIEPEPVDPKSAREAFRDLPPLTLLTSTDRARRTMARAIAQMLGDAGLQVRVLPLDLGVMLDRLDRGDFELATLQMPELTEPNILKWFFHPRGVPGEGGEGRNRARYRSPMAALWLDQASTSADSEVRKSCYAKLARRMQKDLPVIPLWHEDQVAVVSERAREFQLSAEGRWLGMASLR